MDVAIKVENVSKIYKLYKSPQDRIKEVFSPRHKSYHDDYCALSDVSFSVKRGETLGIIGKNGAGKSTLLKLITGVATPTSGSIEVNGQVSALLELGTGFNPEFDGYQNIYLNGTMRGYSKEEMDLKMEEIISFADIGEYISQPVKTYSSGMFARLAFAVMISFRPEILIIDEALSVGDIFFQQKCNAYMKEKMDGVTKILVTHDMNSIANMADKVILLDRGRILQFGEPLEVIEEYLKMMHTDVFSDNGKKNDSSDMTDMASLDTDDTLDWFEIKREEIGGAGDVIIRSCRMEVNNTPSAIVKQGDIVDFYVRLYANREISDVIIGYILKDKYGNSIAGENTLGSGIKLASLKSEQEYIYRLRIKWPEIQEGDYFVTLGVGEGTDQMVHTIQCWAHNVMHIEAIALVPMHGIVNNAILEVVRKDI